jgi:hypothetical protein
MIREDDLAALARRAWHEHANRVELAPDHPNAGPWQQGWLAGRIAGRASLHIADSSGDPVTIPHVLRVVQRDITGSARLYIDGAAFPWATAGGFSLNDAKRGQFPGVSMTIVAERVEAELPGSMLSYRTADEPETEEAPRPLGEPPTSGSDTSPASLAETLPDSNPCPHLVHTDCVASCPCFDQAVKDRMH